MKAYWSVRSGKFAGWQSGDRLYSPSGQNVGYFRGNLIYGLDGRYIGEVYRDDWIGKRSGVAHSISSAVAATAGLAVARYANRAGMPLAGWDDLDYLH